MIRNELQVGSDDFGLVPIAPDHIRNGWQPLHFLHSHAPQHTQAQLYAVSSNPVPLGHSQLVHMEFLQRLQRAIHWQKDRIRR